VSQPKCLRTKRAPPNLTLEKKNSRNLPVTRNNLLYVIIGLSQSLRLFEYALKSISNESHQVSYLEGFDFLFVRLFSAYKHGEHGAVDDGEVVSAGTHFNRKEFLSC